MGLVLLTACAVVVVTASPDFMPCGMAYGRDEQWCGYQCFAYPNNAQYNTPCTEENTCGTNCFRWLEAQSYMDNATCDFSAQYLTAHAAQAGNTGPCVVGGECSESSTFGSCAAFSVCNNSISYQSAPPTHTTDRVCTHLTVCKSTEYIDKPQTPTTDRKCANVTVCKSTEYIDKPQTPTTDRKCANVSACGKHEYASSPATPTSDTTCTNLTVCPSYAYISLPPTTTTDLNCSNVTECPRGVFETRSATATSDRACASTAMVAGVAASAVVGVGVVIFGIALAVHRHKEWVKEKGKVPAYKDALISRRAKNPVYG
jgi:hypothetical protein